MLFLGFSNVEKNLVVCYNNTQSPATENRRIYAGLRQFYANFSPRNNEKDGIIWKTKSF